MSPLICWWYIIQYNINIWAISICENSEASCLLPTTIVSSDRNLLSVSIHNEAKHLILVSRKMKTELLTVVVLLCLWNLTAFADVMLPKSQPRIRSIWKVTFRVSLGISRMCYRLMNRDSCIWQPEYLLRGFHPAAFVVNTAVPIKTARRCLHPVDSQVWLIIHGIIANALYF